MPVVSVVTVSFNAAQTIEDALLATAGQSQPGIEHIVVDGGSQDGTLAVIERHRARLAVVISEADRGIYDAMNKGLAVARGEYIAFLNADDYFASPDALRTLVAAAQQQRLDAVCGNVMQIREGGHPLRLISARTFSPRLLAFGVMPPHPAFLVRTDILRALRGFRTDYRSAGDFEFMLRLFQRDGVAFNSVAATTTVMRVGGQSTSGWRSYQTTTAEVLRALTENGRSPQALRVNLRYFLKALELGRGRALALAGRRYGTDWFR